MERRNDMASMTALNYSGYKSQCDTDNGRISLFGEDTNCKLESNVIS